MQNIRLHYAIIESMHKRIEQLDYWIISTAKRLYLPIARIAFFVIFFYFGILKVIGLSPASPLAEALTAKTIGTQFFDLSFMVLAVIECLIGILFLIPKATRIVIFLLFIHMAVVCSPLVLVPEHVWSSFLVPSLEGQYIIKNIALIAIAIGIAAHVTPLEKNRTKSKKYLR
jgi:uncharacterized membrane protein YkgB